ncbi:MAG TPA: GNAT family N-acetyltransferase [Cellvibrionaceae bacterium]|nr:GNAT family N-acetyltransferase [Cellvibrionaceae bacterium]HMW49584.1 GNAT family N-acetyltransferase [Cellvibrionaceae bacterium]HMW70453.1 GNAT family N-acetyltransferase [Cellvibrionaceae bacterium]HMY37760.1 GNAT family N-acetyltransferase [Marinagarivorans sp.]HNG58425.1 GNAT family N-acetyltransferase [Cellvibrionaceae bacterium]
MNIEIHKNPSLVDIDFIKEGLKGFNKDFGTEDFMNPMAVFVKDEFGNPSGGAMFCIQYTSCYIHLFWIEAGARGRGLGRAVLAAITQECKSYGVKDMFLDTFSFQNTGFYERLGFKSVGCLYNYPKQGINKYFYHAVLI